MAEKTVTPVIRIKTAQLARRIFIACLVIEFSFLFLDYHVNYGRFTEIGAMRKMFNLAREDGFASWFASTQTLLAGLTLLLLYLSANARSESNFKVIGWLILTCFFVYMAVDDGIQGHERFSSALDAMNQGGGNLFAFFPSYAWQVLFLPIMGGLGLFMLFFLFREFNTVNSRVFLLTACSVMALAVGLDFIEGLETDHPWNVIRMLSGNSEFESWTQTRFGKSAYDTLTHFSKSIEETLEMLCISILWCLFIRHLGTAKVSKTRFSFIGNG